MLFLSSYIHQCYVEDAWNKTVARFQARENMRFYRNQTVANMLTQWEVFKGRNADVPQNLFQFIGALKAKIEPATARWNIRKQAAKVCHYKLV